MVDYLDIFIGLLDQLDGLHLVDALFLDQTFNLAVKFREVCQRQYLLVQSLVLLLLLRLERVFHEVVNISDLGANQEWDAQE